MNPSQFVSTHAQRDAAESVVDGDRVQRLVSDIKVRWRKSEEPNAQAFLSLYPQLRRHKSLVLDLAYEEYCLRLEAGEPIEVEKFCDQFSSVSRSLFRQIEVHEYLRHNPGLLRRQDLVQWPDPGETLFEFMVLEELGRGALARVYLCSQAAVGDRQVVMKVAYEGAYEAETLGRLNHPNIMPVYSVVQDDESGVSGICMPFRGRSTLCDVLDLAFEKECRPSRAQIILQAAQQLCVPTDQYDRIGAASRILRSSTYVDGIVFLGIQLADALQHAHDKGILHGDLKPSNVLVTPGGTPLLLDFNLSRDRRSRSSVAGGTLPYMSPEQIQWMLVTSDEECDPPDERSDIFSLGAILYELLCGHLPFSLSLAGQTERQIAEEVLNRQRSERVSLRRVNPDVDHGIAECIESCLSFEQAARPASMRQLANTLRRHFTLQRRARRWVAAHRRAVLIGTLPILFAIIAGVAFLAGRDPYSVRQYNRGIEHYRARQFQEAIACFDRALQADSGYAEAFYQRGRAFLQRGDFRIAREDFWKAISLRTNGRDAACLAYCFSRLKDHVGARSWYEKAIALGYESVGVYNNLGYSYLNKAQYAEAKEALDRAIELNDRSYVPHLNRALVDLRQAQQDAAYVPHAGLADVERAIGIAPANGELYYIAACLCGYAARRDPGRVHQGLKWLNLACNEGVNARKFDFQNDPALLPFRGHREFAEILNRPAPKSPPVKASRLLDPIDEDSTLLQP